jgi:hypothetical protein
MHVPQSVYSGSVWDRSVKQTNVKVRVGCNMALSNGMGLLKEKEMQGYMNKHPILFSHI